jgi:hypothetical protein
MAPCYVEEESMMGKKIPLPFNALSATQLFNSMGKEKPDTK